MHLKRQKTPKNWPIYRKGTKYVARPLSDLKKGISILMVLRDVLNIVNNRKEAKQVIYLKKILLNGKHIKDEKQSALLFDVVKIADLNKNYIVSLSEKGKIILSEISEKESDTKISKIINKKILRGRKIQLNLNDGRNFISEIPCKTNDSVVIDLRNKKIEKCLSLKTGSEVIVFSGKHSGKKGVVKNIQSEKKIAEIDSKGEIINVLIKQFMVIK